MTSLPVLPSLPLLLTAGALAAYLAAVLRLRRGQRRRWPLRRCVAAVAAATLVLLAVSPLLHASPSDGGGHHGAAPDDAVGHMVQHLLLGMYAPLLVVPAAPVTLALAVAPLRWRSSARTVLASAPVRVLGHPVVAAVPAVLGMHVLFLTPLYGLSLQLAWVHHLVQLHLLLSGCLLAWALVGGDPVPPRSGLLLRLAVLVVAAGSHAHLATLVYARAPRLPPGNPFDLEQTQQAALWMYYGGDVAELGLALLVCLAWYRRRGARLRRRGSVQQVQAST